MILVREVNIIPTSYYELQQENPLYEESNININIGVLFTPAFSTVGCKLCALIWELKEAKRVNILISDTYADYRIRRTKLSGDSSAVGANCPPRVSLEGQMSM